MRPRAAISCTGSMMPCAYCGALASNIIVLESHARLMSATAGCSVAGLQVRFREDSDCLFPPDRDVSDCHAQQVPRLV